MLGNVCRIDAFGHRIFCKIFRCKGAIGQNFAHEQTKDGKRSARTLTEGAGSEVYLAVFSAYPGTAYEFRRHAHKPCIGVRVGSSGFSADVETLVPIPLSDVGGTDKTLGRSAGITDAGVQKRLHVVSFLGIEHGMHVAMMLIHHFTVGIFDFLDRVGAVVLAAVGHTCVGADQIGEIHVAGSEREGGGIAQFGFDAHVLGCFDDIADANFLTELDCDGIHALCKCRAERKFGTREASVGVVGSPHGGLPILVRYVHSYV